MLKKLYLLLTLLCCSARGMKLDEECWIARITTAPLLGEKRDVILEKFSRDWTRLDLADDMPCESTLYGRVQKIENSKMVWVQINTYDNISKKKKAGKAAHSFFLPPGGSTEFGYIKGTSLMTLIIEGPTLK